MAQKIENLRDLFIEQGKELYNISLKEQKELPEIKRRACDPKLKQAIDREIEAAKDHKKRIEKVFSELNISLSPTEVNESFDAIMNQAKDLMERSQDDDVRDAAIINAVQRLNHSKITGFGSFRSYADEIGESVIATTLNNSMEVEKAIDETLSEIATSDINRKAVTAKIQ